MSEQRRAVVLVCGGGASTNVLAIAGSRATVAIRLVLITDNATKWNWMQLRVSQLVLRCRSTK